MNKLTEIKENFKINAPWWFGVSREDMEYLFSLLEEKDKALAFYADPKNYEQEYLSFDTSDPIDGYYEVSNVIDDAGNIARKALNTSSNNEGEI